MTLTARERRILKLAEKWAASKGRFGWSYGRLYDTLGRSKGKQSCATARASALTPHILQQEADLELLRKLVGSIEDTGGHVESDIGCQYCEAYQAARSRLKEME